MSKIPFRYISLPLEYASELKPYNYEQVGRLIMGLFDYALYGKEMVFEGDERFFATRMMLQHDNAVASLEKKRKAAAESYKKRKEAAEGKTEDPGLCPEALEPAGM